MSGNIEAFDMECEVIRKERASYSLSRPRNIVRFEGFLSAIFYFLGFIALALIPFSQITLMEATCLFVISYVIAPSEIDLGESVIKGMAEDLGYIRANLSCIRKAREEKQDKSKYYESHRR